MIADVLRPEFLRAHLEGVRDAVAAGVLDDPSGWTAAGAVAHDHEGDVPFLARDPVAAMLQTVVEQRLREHHPDAIRDARPAPGDLVAHGAQPHAAEALLDPRRFSHDDPGWVIEIGKALLERLARGNHPFNPRPAQVRIADDARVVLVGDWGTGLPRARAVAAHMAAEVGEALAAGREAHVIHLGDVYYSGDAREYDRHVLDAGLWPVDAAGAAAGVTSWSLNGNHDMYSGGWGYFDHLLADERFAAQRSPDGRGTSFFRIASPSWDLVGLDTSWDRRPLRLGHAAVLHDPQAAFVERVARESERRLMLLSHHQLVSVYDPADIADELPTKLGGVLAGGRVAAWFWGHEHRCMGYAPTAGVAVPRCLGHGGVPVVSHPLDAPVPPPGLWEERGFLDAAGRHWGRFGFAVLDLDGPRIDVRYVDDLGERTRTERIA
ncbi:MAG: hypothetical protein QOG35_87 [Solirubrobacteraceae bacterium]|jgi:hypothetical protein|nr:hypothetical protein [Solirubrobacteraceae bacterium]